MSIALDVMGGDLAPKIRLDAAEKAVKEDKISLVLVGDEKIIKTYVDKHKLPSSLIEIVPSTQTVEMGDSPIQVVRQKKDSSMRVCFDLHTSNHVSGLVSAGNSGAMVAHSVLLLKLYPCIERPCFSVFIPKRESQSFLLCDAGANVDCTVKQLVQFALLGSLYLTGLHERKRPKVGLLNIGAEDNKGNVVAKNTFDTLSALETNEFEFIGNLEGKEVFESDVDILLVDGFAGNIFLKSIQGAVKYFYYNFKREVHNGSLIEKASVYLLKNLFKRITNRIDYSNFSGAPVLGVQGNAFVCHGGSNAQAIYNAIKVACWAEQENLSERMADKLSTIEIQKILC